MIALTACEKAVLPEEGLASEEASLVTGSAKLNIFTSTPGDSEEETIAEGKVYIFNSTGNCVQLLSMDEESQQITTQLPPGQYTLYAIGGNDLTRFALPTQSEATSSSVITRLAGKVMDDLMMASVVVDLEEEESLNQNITLEHKVICLDDIEIRQVPQTATKVEVTFTPLYSSVCLDGSFPASPTESYKIALTKQADGSTWKAAPDQMLFPSKGTPTVNVTISTSTGNLSYSFTAEALSANHHFSIVGTYQTPQGVTLTGILTAGDWGEDKEIAFDIDESDVEVRNYIAGEFCGDYYVVSVDETHRKAVLLAKEKISYTAPSGNATNAQWKAALTAPMAALEKPAGVTSDWRLPTLEEVGIFSKDTQVTYFGETSHNTPNFYCVDGDGVLYWAYTHQNGNTFVLNSGDTGFVNIIYLRPVIDVEY